MSKSWNRTETWVGLMVAAVGLGLLGLLGLWGYVSATSEPLHPNPSEVPAVAGETPGPMWTRAVERGRQIARTSLSEQNLPGLSVAVGVGDDLIWAEGFGWADIEGRVPVSPATKFRIGTASIAITSAAIGVLLESNRLTLDEVIQTYVPAFPQHPWPVTVRQLMGHVAGVRNDGGDEGPLFTARCERPADALEYFGARPLLFEPGTAYRYSSYGWILLSAAVESAANQPFLDFVRDQVLEPSGMRDTLPDRAQVPAEGQATSYFPRFAADPRYGPDLMRPLDYSCYAGASVFLSTPSDLVRFAIAIGRGGLLQPSTVQQLQAPQRLASGAETGYGLGWDIETVTLAGQQTRWVGHEGAALGGMVASLMTFPEHGIVVAVTSNTSYADTEALATRIAEVFVDPGGEAGAGPTR